MSKLLTIFNDDTALIFNCPGCEEHHQIWIKGPTKWEWNGSMDKPTFSPSIKVEHRPWTPPVTPENMDEYNRNPWPQTQEHKICHSFIRDGMIEFCSDSTHKLAGQTVPLPDFDL